MIQFAHLRFAIGSARYAQPVPAVSNMLLRFARLAVPNASGSPGRIPEDIRRYARINSPRCASWIGNRIPVARDRRTGSIARRLPRSKVFRRTGNTELRAISLDLRFPFRPFRTPMLRALLTRIRLECSIRSPVWRRTSAPIELKEARCHNQKEE